MDATTHSDHRSDFHGRVEDDPLVRGRGRYIADAPLPNQAYAHFVRSPHAFARIVKVDVEAAAKAAGVVGVLTAADFAGIGSIGRLLVALATDTLPELAATARLVSVSRFNRCKSARMSAACW